MLRAAARTILGAGAAGVVLASGGLHVAPVAAQAPVATLDVQPPAVAAGDDVTVSGTCPAGSSATVQAFGPDNRAPGDEFEAAFSGQLEIPDADAFSEPFTIPEETAGGDWRFSLLCTGPVTPTPPEALVSVTAGTPVPVTVTVVPNPIRPGQSAEVSGTGCLATGRPMDVAVVKLLGLRDTTPVGVDATTTPSATGEYAVTLDVPADFPGTRSLLTVDCFDSTSAGVQYRRTHGEGALIEAPVPPTTPTTAPSPTTRPPPELARTGTPSSTPGLVVAAAVLVASGGALVAAARRRRPAS